MTAQHALGPMRLEWMKKSGLVQETQALAQPRRSAELERQRQEYALSPRGAVRIIDVIPQVAVGRVLAGLRLHHVAMPRVCLVQQRLEGEHLGDVRKQRPRPGVREP